MFIWYVLTFNSQLLYSFHSFIINSNYIFHMQMQVMADLTLRCNNSMATTTTLPPEVGYNMLFQEMGYVANTMTDVVTRGGYGYMLRPSASGTSGHPTDTTDQPSSSSVVASPPMTLQTYRRGTYSSLRPISEADEASPSSSDRPTRRIRRRS